MTLSPRGREQLVAVPSIGRASEVTPRRAAPEADATRDLYERYARQIFSYCLHQLGNREEAEDATQSTFLNAFRGFKRGVDPEFESAWLYKIAQNVCLTRQRSSSRRRKVETPGDLEAMQDYVPAHQVDSDELIRLPEALDAMPEQQRRALLLREWQGLSYKEIGAELDLSQAAVETLLFRARRSLAAGLSEEPVKKAAGLTKKLGSAGGDLASFLSILKSLLLTGGIKAVTAVATVAATSVVAATPVTRNAVVDVVAPGHDKVPVHQVAGKPVKGSVPTPVSAPFSLVPKRSVATPAASPQSAPLTAAAAKTRQRTLVLRAHNAVGGVAVAHALSTTEPSAAISAPSVPTPTTETPATPAAATVTETPAPSHTEPVSPPTAPQPTVAQPPAQPVVTEKPKEAEKPKSDLAPPNAPKKDDSGNNGSATKEKGESRATSSTTVSAQPVAIVTPAAPPVNTDPQPTATSTTTKSDNKSDNNKNDGKKDAEKTNKILALRALDKPSVAVPTVTTPAVTTTPAATTTPTTTAPTTTPSAATSALTVTNPAPPQGDKGERPAEGHKGDGKGESRENKDGNGKRK